MKILLGQVSGMLKSALLGSMSFKFFFPMAAMMKGNVFPSISPDYYMAGATTTVKGLKKIEYERFVSRAERIEEAERHFARTYKQETGNELPSDARGIAVIQLGQYPFGREIYLNPTLKSKCAAEAMELDRPQRTDYVFLSRTYFLEDGKPEFLLDGNSVLRTEVVRRVAFILQQKMAWQKLEPFGSIRLRTKCEFYPYLLWVAETETNDIKYLLFSLMNGGIFIVNHLPERRDCEDHFILGSMVFKRQPDGWLRY